MIEQKSMPPSHVSKELFSDTSKEISELQKQVADVEQTVLTEWESLVGELSADNIDQAKIYALKYESKLAQFIDLSALLVKLYQDEINKLQKLNLDDKMNDVQKKQISAEVKHLERLCSLGLRTDGDVECYISERIFPQLLENVEEHCPLLYSILQTLLVSDARKRIHKTPEYKLKCGVNALALLLSVRNQKFSNDVRLLFGLLCASHGAGKQFINMLNAVGLSSHWDTM